MVKSGYRTTILTESYKQQDLVRLDFSWARIQSMVKPL